MSSYVAGLMFSTCREFVGLIHKKKPAYQKGKLNAIGGKIEGDESPLQAMIREFEEETGVKTNEEWKPFVHLYNGNFEVFFYVAFSDKLQYIHTTTEEKVEIVKVRDLPFTEHMKNLRWLIPLALDPSLDRTTFIPIPEVN